MTSSFRDDFKEGENAEIVPSKKYKFYVGGGAFVGAAGTAVAVSLLVKGSQEFLLGLILDNAKELILNSPVVSVIIIAAASAVVAGLIGFAIGYLIDKRSAKATPVELTTSSDSRHATVSDVGGSLAPSYKQSQNLSTAESPAAPENALTGTAADLAEDTSSSQLETAAEKYVLLSGGGHRSSSPSLASSSLFSNAGASQPLATDTSTLQAGQGY